MAAEEKARGAARPGAITLFLGGDVMTGRGIDQVLPHPGSDRLYEPYVKSAVSYVHLAEQVNGKIARPVDFSYIWGDALDELRSAAPDLRVVNLETAITADGEPWLNKGIHYRMHPANIPCLTAAGLDCCVLANNHVLDWGYVGLTQTLAILREAGIATAGAGADLEQAAAPAVLPVEGKGRVLVFAFGTDSSGVLPEWAAERGRAGVNFLPDLSAATVQAIAERIRAIKRPGDVVVASIHWDSNWGYDVPAAHARFAHGLIDDAGVDIVHGHSSHHPKGIEVHRGKPILYGCGDLLNDYEGIGGYEEFRADLALMYFVTVDPDSGELLRLRMVPMQMRRFRLNRSTPADTAWLRKTLDREARRLGARVELAAGHDLVLAWH